MNLLTIKIIAQREFGHAIRARLVFWMTILIALLTLAIAFTGGSLTSGGDTNPGSLALSLIHLVMYTASLIALLLSYDAVIDEEERGTLSLLATYPASRLDFLLGKYLGYAGVLAITMTFGVAIPAAALRLSPAMAIMLALQGYVSGLAFLAIGLAVSARMTTRTSALVVALLCWMSGIFLFDLVLTGLLVGTQGAIPDEVVKMLMLLNPAQAGRILGISWLLSPAEAALFGVEGWLRNPVLLVSSQIVWIIVGILIALPRRVWLKTR